MQVPLESTSIGCCFQEYFPAASGWCWSSIFTTAAACDGYLSFIFKDTPHTHTHTILKLPHLHTCTHWCTWTLLFLLYISLSLSLFLQHSFQLNFQQKCATLSPSATVVTLSYSELSGRRLVTESLSREPCYITYTHFTGLPYQSKAYLCESTEVGVRIRQSDVLWQIYLR